MSVSNFLYNQYANIYLKANIRPDSQYKLLMGNSTEDAVPFEFIPGSAGEYTICTNANGTLYCLEVWNVRGTAVHVGLPNNNGSQVWTTSPVDGGGFKLSNFNAGDGMFLDIDSVSQRTFKFSKGDSDGQIFKNVENAVIASAVPWSTSTLLPTATSAPSSTMTSTPNPSNVPTDAIPSFAPTPKTHPGAIVGVAVGCSLVPILFACLFFGLVLRRRKARKALEDVDFVRVGGSGPWSQLGSAERSAQTTEK